MSANNIWTDFWKSNPPGFNEVMRQSTRVFADKLESVMPLNKDDNLLDLGCGPGFLIDFLHPKVGAVHGIDVSEKYIAICRERFKQFKNISFSVAEAGGYSKYAEAIKDYQINKIIVLSVLQYFTSADEVKKMLWALKDASPKGTQCLLADILPAKHGFFNDAWSVLLNSVKRMYLPSFINFMWYVTFSEYKNLKNAGMLHLDKSFFIALAEEMQIDVVITPTITLHPDRFSVLLTF